MPTASSIQWKNLPTTALGQDSQLTQTWDVLNAARGDVPFLAADAIGITLNTLGTGTERLLVGYADGHVVAMFLLVNQAKFQWSTFQPSQMPLGAWVADASLPLLDIVGSLQHGPLALCLVLSITQVDPNIAPRGEDTTTSHTTDYIDTGWIDIEGTFDSYWATRGKNLRHNMRKQRTKLAARHTTPSMQVLRNPADIAPAIARYGTLESAGWKALSGTAIHPDNAQGRFYRDLLEQASTRGEAVVYQYLFDDILVAMNLCLLRNGTLVVLKTTYDESFKAISSAFFLREEELREIFREGQIKRIEYFGKIMDWHTKLTDKKRALYHLTVYRWPFIKKLIETRHRKVATATTGATTSAGRE